MLKPLWDKKFMEETGPAAKLNIKRFRKNEKVRNFKLSSHQSAFTLPSL